MLDFAELYTQFAGDVYRFAFWLSGCRLEAEDITAETFARAWARPGSIRMETLKGYLLKIARNLYLERIRKGTRDEELKETCPDPAPGPESRVQTRMAVERVNAILQGLPECDRTAFLLRVAYELSYGEIARVLEISEVNARVKVHRVRKQLLLRTMEAQD